MNIMDIIDIIDLFNVCDVVLAPARILPGPQIVIAQLNLPSYLQCNAIGNPEPRVTWSEYSVLFD
jgi:hypothetical protein